MNVEFFSLLAGSGFVGQLIVGALALISLISWGIMLEKWLALRRAQDQTDRFLEVFQQEGVRQSVYQAALDNEESPESRLFVYLYNELTSIAKRALPGGEQVANAEPVALLRKARVSLSTATELLDRYIQGIIPLEMNRLESRLSFLATTGAIGPFVGLFGTVWGILSAFDSIAAQQSASLATVAPGISAALITTVAGLAAAIPAVVGYNVFIRRLRRISVELDCFAAFFLVQLQGYEVAPGPASSGRPQQSRSASPEVGS